MSPAPARSLGRGARARILGAARELFADPGINATGIADIVERARVSRRTLYQHFASKDDLIVAYLRELAADPETMPQRLLERDDLTARARLLEMFGALGDGPRPLRGDPFLAAAVELADPDHPGRRVIARRQGQLGELLGEVCREAGAGQAEVLGRRLLVLYAGGAAAVLAADDPRPAAEATAIARILLEAAID
ncbi:MAG TPA: helix-turn-helix domain-containing protein [Solirubrobacteraceae bacterium]|nr:helix-turn-helix domain-containing protein [Solirubrobacteraceae bacterium]